MFSKIPVNKSRLKGLDCPKRKQWLFSIYDNNLLDSV